MPRAPAIVFALGTIVLAGAVALAGEPTAARVPSAERGYRAILDTPYVTPTFDEQDVDLVWTVWPEALRARAAKASKEERRRMAFERYGLTPREDDPSKPLQWVVDARGGWTINCFACHGGQVGGKAVPGLPNAHVALEDLVDDVGLLAAKQGDKKTAMNVALWKQLPLGSTHGTTNAVVFGISLGQFRDRDLKFVFPKEAPKFVHHDLDAPAWWNVRKRPRLYQDGLVEKGHRSLMQFLLVPTNGAERIKSLEDDFKDILAYVESLSPPAWPFEVDRALAERGRVAFAATCARCHGTYGAKGSYPSVAVPIDEVGTDRLRFDAVSKAERERFADSWFTEFKPQKVDCEPVGYLAPPLDGIWASAPYFHNGSSPTLWHVLHPESRAKAWRKTSPTGYDRARVGLDVETRDAAPEDVSDPWTRRSWFDSSKPGKSVSGHAFPAALSEPDRRAVLEYLKTL